MSKQKRRPTDPQGDCDPVGAVEIAARVGVSRRTVDQWRQRYSDFPAPRWNVGGRPAWDWTDIAPWLEATDRTRVADFL